MNNTTTDSADSILNIIAFCHEQGRVCPMPQKWDELWKLLPNRENVGAGWEPSIPLILNAWYETSNEEKMDRLAEHIKWADKHGNLADVSQYLHSLPESDWYHIND